MKYIVECGLPGTISGCNTIEDIQRYLDADPHPGYRLASCSEIAKAFLVWEEFSPNWERNSGFLLEACKKAYRKHALDDESIAWGELTEELGGVLGGVMGAEEFDEWINEVDPEKTV